ncbi:hypothetical protein B0H16DRAFT_1743203 [Mycena metata]|uniref:Uncharacterized protein n=1 Tax=Mycena metata TaxID=1033252 RepID=A0AAD7H718_9AGAR|nr:hypothetical protein B0H16DRAFT_1743203 [Mycena metata]
MFSAASGSTPDGLVQEGQVEGPNGADEKDTFSRGCHGGYDSGAGCIGLWAVRASRRLAVPSPHLAPFPIALSLGVDLLPFLQTPPLVPYKRMRTIPATRHAHVIHYLKGLYERRPEDEVGISGVDGLSGYIVCLFALLSISAVVFFASFHPHLEATRSRPANNGWVGGTMVRLLTLISSSPRLGAQGRVRVRNAPHISSSVLSSITFIFSSPENLNFLYGLILSSPHTQHPLPGLRGKRLRGRQGCG